VKTIHILQIAGFGDTLSLITRLPSLKDKYSDYSIKIYLGGFGKAPLFSKQQLEREGYQASIIKNLTYHNQLSGMSEMIKQNFVKEGDLFFDASFCNEIFDNKSPWFCDFDMYLPYKYKVEDKSITIDCPNMVAINPLTKSGNSEGFDSDVQRGRFWNREEWKSLCIKLSKNGYTPVFCGYGDEDWGLYEELKKEGYLVHSISNQSVEAVIDFLSNQVVAGVFCNSWQWEITSRIYVPTVCFYTKNHFFINNHIPKVLSLEHPSTAYKLESV